MPISRNPSDIWISTLADATHTHSLTRKIEYTNVPHYIDLHFPATSFKVGSLRLDLRTEYRNPRGLFFLVFIFLEKKKKTKN